MVILGNEYVDGSWLETYRDESWLETCQDDWFMFGPCIGFELENDFVSLWFDDVAVDYGFSSRWRLLRFCDSNRV